MRTKRHSTGNRRRSGRRSVDWAGRCSVAGLARTPTFPCVVFDASLSGAGVEIVGCPDIREGQTLVLDVERVGATVIRLRLRCAVRNVVATPDDSTRVGVEVSFDVPSSQIAKTLFALAP